MKRLASVMLLLLTLFCPMLLSQNQSTNKSLQLSIAPSALTITTASLPAGKVGTAYASTTLQVSGGVAPYVWSVCTVAPCTTTPLPAGMTLSAAGVLSGTPTAACNCIITFQVTDNSGSVAKLNINFTPSTSPGVTAYNLKRGIAQGAETQLVQLPASQHSYTDGVPNVSGSKYYYVATALAGVLESAKSNEASALIP